MLRNSLIAFLIILLLGCMSTDAQVSTRTQSLIKPEALVLPSQTPMKGHSLDENGVVVAYLPDGTEAYNVFEIAMQAIEGRAAFQMYLDRGIDDTGLTPRLSDSNVAFSDPYRKFALQWLIDNASEVKGSGLVWKYRFDNAYNDVEVKSPWGSAFGQAHVIEAFAKAYRDTGDERYLNYVKKAYKPYQEKMTDGGFLSILNDGNYFFEEVPSPPAAHILNGHMVSTLTLLKYGKEFQIADMTNLGLKGLKTLNKHIQKYDTGYWSKYDLNPKKGELIFRLRPEENFSSSPIKVDSVSIRNKATKEGYTLDVGGNNDAQGAWRISGLEWTQVEKIDGFSTRGIEFGPSKHCGPVKGGSIQNSYFVMELPYLDFPDLLNPPKLELSLHYKDVGKGRLRLELQDISHGNFMYFRTLPSSAFETDGSGKWKEINVEIPFSALGWYVGIDYQKYHVKLLRELYALTKRDFLFEYAERWAEYIELHSEVNPEYGMSIKNNCSKG